MARAAVHFALWIQRHARPETCVERDVDGVFLHVIDDDALGLDTLVVSLSASTMSRVPFICLRGAAYGRE